VVTVANTDLNSSQISGNNSSEEQDEELPEGLSLFMFKLKKNLRDIYEAMTLPEIYQVVLYFIILGIIGPSFSDFMYYFLLDVCKITKF